MPESLEQSGVMRGDYDRGAFFMNPQKEIHGFLRHIRVQISRGLVGQNQDRIVHQRPRDRDPLLLSSGKRQRTRVVLVLEAELAQQMEGPSPALPMRHPDHLGGQGHILKRRHAGKKLKLLKDEAYLLAQLRDSPATQARNVPAVHDDLAVRCFLFAEKQPQQCSFTGPAGSAEKYEFTLFDVKMDIRQGRIVGRIDLRNTKELDHSNCQHGTSNIVQKILDINGGGC